MRRWAWLLGVETLNWNGISVMLSVVFYSGMVPATSILSRWTNSEVPVIHFKEAPAGSIVRSTLVPSVVNKDYLQWTHLGENEQYSVVLHRDKDRGIQVLELVWDIDNDDYNTIDVDPSTIELTLYF